MKIIEMVVIEENNGTKRLIIDRVYTLLEIVGMNALYACQCGYEFFANQDIETNCYYDEMCGEMCPVCPKCEERREIELNN